MYPTNFYFILIFIKHFVAGAISGFAVGFVEGPVDFVKCQLQMRPQYNLKLKYILTL